MDDNGLFRSQEQGLVSKFIRTYRSPGRGGEETFPALSLFLVPRLTGPFRTSSSRQSGGHATAPVAIAMALTLLSSFPLQEKVKSRCIDSDEPCWEDMNLQF